MPNTIRPSTVESRWSGNPAGFIYGVLAVATVVAAESTRHETFGKVLCASLVVVALYGLAHAYSHYLGSRLQRPSDRAVREIVVSLAHAATIVEGALLPVGTLAGAWLAGASLETGVTAALWCAGAEIVILEVIAAARQRLRPREMVTDALVGITMGLGILGVRLLLH
jgi:hypothetical protein